MLYKNHFYNGMTKKYAKVIGSLLSDIDVVVFDGNGAESTRLKVPVTYSPKEKFIRRIYEDPDLNRQTAITLPRIGYELQSFVYAPDRKLSSKLKILFYDPAKNNSALYAYMPVPYDFYFQATVITKTQEDMFLIIELLLPFFTPDYTVKMKGINNPNISFDVPITLVSTLIEDTYSGELDERREVTCDLLFVLKGFIFGPVRENGLIKQYNTEMFIEPGSNLLDPNVISLLVNNPNKNVFIDTGVTPSIDGLTPDLINALDLGISFKQLIDEPYACNHDGE